jgi:hypothetical protein
MKLESAASRLRIRSINIPLIRWARRGVESHAGTIDLPPPEMAALVGQRTDRVAIAQIGTIRVLAVCMNDTPTWRPACR